jgi:hypothetical protein
MNERDYHSGKIRRREKNTCQINGTNYFHSMRYTNITGSLFNQLEKGEAIITRLCP